MAKLGNLFEILGEIKDLKRSGWKRKKVSAAESVAAHSFGVALLTLLLAPNHLDKEKCLKLAIVHDLQEVLVGDFTPFDNITPEEKAKLEQKAVKELAEKLEYPELEELFAEYEAKETPEAKFVKDIDRIEAIIQAKYYDKNQRCDECLLPEFYSYGSTRLCSKEKIFAEILEEIKE